MNCKPGDLAMVVSPLAHRNIGKIVRCLRLSEWSGMTDATATNGIRYGPTWEVDGLYVSLFGEQHKFVLDEFLRPIRNPGDDAKDESLSWLPPVPNDISAEDPQDLREALKQWAEEQR